ncbi:MAG: DUF3408 domain-containing protein [Muribaculaceae bacterium]
MAEDKNKGFDAANFLENYREDIATPIRQPKSSGDSQSGGESPPPKTEIPTEDKPHLSETEVLADNNGLADMTRIDEPESDEYDFIQEYLVEHVPIGFSKSGCQIAVTKKHRDMIATIIALLGDRLTFGGYVDNVLRKHFEEYGDVIQRLIKKNTNF